MTILGFGLSIALAAAPAHAIVLPGWATPLGWSLADMAEAVANFSISGNNLMYYPSTPFQIIYRQPGSGCNLGNPGSCIGNSFTVHPGTYLYVKFFFIDDSPPVIGTFPTDQAGAQNYMFAADQLGGHDLHIIIDGAVTTLGPAYVPAPVPIPAQPFGPGTAYDGTNLIQMGAFVTPLSRGHHTITIDGDFDGQLILDTFGGPVHFQINYTVDVVP
ncbi:MAG TPA: hypothetical protein VGM03_07665 [Phycisphaerae bacterium]|jgi:hypothetical protein